MQLQFTMLILFLILLFSLSEQYTTNKRNENDQPLSRSVHFLSFIQNRRVVNEMFLHIFELDLHTSTIPFG